MPAAPDPSATPPDSPDTPTASRRRWFAGLAALGGLGLLGAKAEAHGWGRGSRDDPEHMARHVERRMDRLVRDVGGTPQQKDRLVAIATAAMAELRPLRDQSRQARVRALDLLAAPAIDRAALEQARVAQMQAADTRSRRMLQAMAEAAEVLTPEQRVKAAARLKDRMERRRHG